MNNEERRDRYVYVHKLDGVVVYVGSGTGDRYYHKSTRSNEHKAVWDSLEKIVIKSQLTNQESIHIEQTLIDTYWESGRLFNRKKNVDRVIYFTYEDISKFVKYDENSPSCLSWVVDRKSGQKAGEFAGYKHLEGYWKVTINGKNYSAHRVIYCLEHKTCLEESLVIDHIDNNRSNNKIENLRLVSLSDNAKNKKHNKSNVMLQNITEYTKGMRFIVRYSETNLRIQKYFSYTDKTKLKSPNNFKTREEALEAAIAYRQTLVDKGLILITSDGVVNE